MANRALTTGLRVVSLNGINVISIAELTAAMSSIARAQKASGIKAPVKLRLQEPPYIVRVLLQEA
jgi:hypothetical protein